MIYLLQLLVSGVALGAIYALIALGFVIVFRASDALNFAHGSLVVLGAYLTSVLVTGAGMPFAVGALLALVAVVALSVVIERGLVRPMLGQPLLVLAILTIGLDIVVRTVVHARLGSQQHSVGDPFGSGVVHLGDVAIAQSRLAALIVGIVIAGAFFAWFKLSPWGVAMRAAADDPGAAALMGIQLGRVSAVAWAIAGALAVIAGIFLSTYPTAGVDVSLLGVAFAAFPAAVLGGLDSPGGACVGGVIIGIVQQLAQGYQDQLSFVGNGFSQVVPYVVLIVVLLVRPSGLFGTKELERV